MRPRGSGILAQASYVNPMAHRRERVQQLDAMVELHRRPAKVVLVEQVVQPDADLQDALVQVPNLRGRRAPQQLERFVLLEKLTRVEFIDPAHQLRRRRRRARGGQIG